MTDKAFAQADPDWLALISAARDWLSGPLGQLLLDEERRMLDDELGRYFGGYLVHYGPCAETPPQAQQVRRNVRLGAPLPGVEIVCEERAWPLSEHAADVVVLQHGLDFSLSPHGLLREAAASVRPGGHLLGGHLLIVGINPWSSWGLRHVFARDALRQARCISPSRVADWLNLLGSLRWRNAASGAIVRRWPRQPGKRGWRAGSAWPVTGNWWAAASIYWWHARSWLACGRSSRYAASRSANWCRCRWPRSTGAPANPETGTFFRWKGCNER